MGNLLSDREHHVFPPRSPSIHTTEKNRVHSDERGNVSRSPSTFIVSSTIERKSSSSNLFEEEQQSMQCEFNNNISNNNNNSNNNNKQIKNSSSHISSRSYSLCESDNKSFNLINNNNQVNMNRMHEESTGSTSGASTPRHSSGMSNFRVTSKSMNNIFDVQNEPSNLRQSAILRRSTFTNSSDGSNASITNTNSDSNLNNSNNSNNNFSRSSNSSIEQARLFDMSNSMNVESSFSSSCENVMLFNHITPGLLSPSHSLSRSSIHSPPQNSPHDHVMLFGNSANGFHSPSHNTSPLNSNGGFSASNSSNNSSSEKINLSHTAFVKSSKSSNVYTTDFEIEYSPVKLPSNKVR